MENKQIKFEIDNIDQILENMKKHMSALFGDVVWDLNKELKSEVTYYRKKITDNILDAWKHLENLQNIVTDIQKQYKWASKEPEESKKSEESEESEEMPW